MKRRIFEARLDVERAARKTTIERARRMTAELQEHEKLRKTLEAVRAKLEAHRVKQEASRDVVARPRGEP